MRNHRIFLPLCLALWLWPGASAGAAEQEGASPPPPSVHNEYNNSTVYNGDVYTSNAAPGSNGFAGTWRDPETGDIITSVIAPRQPQPQEWNTPVIVAPQIYPGGGRPYPPGSGLQPPYTPGPPPRPYPKPHPGFQPGWQGARPPQGHLTPGVRPPSALRPRPHAPGSPYAPRNSVAPSTGIGGIGGMGNTGSAVHGAGGR